MTDWTSILDEGFENGLRDLMRDWRVPGLALVLVPDENEVAPIFFTHGEKTMGRQPVTKTVCMRTTRWTLLTSDPLPSCKPVQARCRSGRRQGSCEGEHSSCEIDRPF
jgi:hypothetical protein